MQLRMVFESKEQKAILYHCNNHTFILAGGQFCKVNNESMIIATLCGNEKLSLFFILFRLRSCQAVVLLSLHDMDTPTAAGPLWSVW